MHEKEKETQVASDSILGHFILAGLFVFEALIRILNLLIPTPNSKSFSNDKYEDDLKSKIKSKNAYFREEALSSKSPEELRKFLKGIDILPTIEKNQLVKLIISNDVALNKLIEAEKKSALKAMTVAELKNILKGNKNISKLKKLELINIIISKGIDF